MNNMLMNMAMETGVAFALYQQGENWFAHQWEVTPKEDQEAKIKELMEEMKALNDELEAEWAEDGQEGEMGEDKEAQCEGEDCPDEEPECDGEDCPLDDEEEGDK